MIPETLLGGMALTAPEEAGVTAVALDITDERDG